VEWFKNGFLPMLDRVDDLRDVLTSGGRTMAQGCLAWLWARSPRNIPIPGTKRVSQLEENMKAMDFGPLTQDQLQQIEVILGRSQVAA
jgi:aryl-alcohol dehydrogenase-like predicted oxidoreductase